MTDEEFAAHFAELQQTMRQIGEALAAWVAHTMPLIARVVRRLMAWIQRQGILSPAYAYATPAIRRRAARQRAYLAMHAKNHRIH